MIIIFWATFCARIEKIRKSFDEHGAVVSKVHIILCSLKSKQNIVFIGGLG